MRRRRCMRVRRRTFNEQQPCRHPTSYCGQAGLGGERSCGGGVLGRGRYLRLCGRVGGRYRSRRGGERKRFVRPRTQASLPGAPARGRDRLLGMVEEAAVDAAEEGAGRRRVSLLLAMAMFVLVIDTSLMNVSISKVVHDLGTTVSAVQSAIALEALISAAFILINSKVGDLIGRKRAYIQIGRASCRERV